MARITVREAQAWVEGTKFTIADPFSQQDSDMLDMLEEECLSIIANAYDTSTWVDPSTTPKLVRTAIAKKFTAWAYRRQYSEAITEDDAIYAAKLIENAKMIIKGIADGTIKIPDLPPSIASTPVFYPTDASSNSKPTRDDMSLGPAKFSMNTIF